MNVCVCILTSDTYASVFWSNVWQTHNIELAVTPNVPESHRCSRGDSLPEPMKDPENGICQDEAPNACML